LILVLASAEPGLDVTVAPVGSTWPNAPVAAAW
jgi:hypothetical protein